MLPAVAPAVAPSAKVARSITSDPADLDPRIMWLAAKDNKARRVRSSADVASPGHEDSSRKAAVDEPVPPCAGTGRQCPSGVAAARRRIHRLDAVVPTRRSLLDEANEILVSWQWHVVQQPRPAEKGSAGVDAAADTHELPQGCRGFAVLCWAAGVKAASDTVYRACMENVGVPVVAVLLDTPHGEAEVETVLEAQRELQDAGADDVILPADGYSPEMLRVLLAMSAQRAERRGQDCQMFSKWMHEKEQQQGRGTDQQGMFWQCAHRVFEGFPKLDPAIPSDSASFFVGKQLGQHKVVQKLGAGAFGAVYRCSNAETGEQEAIKVISKAGLNEIRRVRNIWQETSILRRVGHPNVVSLHGAVHTQHHIILFMELAGSVDLHRAVVRAGGHFDADKALNIGAQLAEALAHCHSVGVAHLDVKPPNVVLDEAGDGRHVAKLVDFGLAIEVEQSRGIAPRCGTMPFCAPEVLCGGGSHFRSPDICKADVWSHGITVLEIAFGLGSTCRMLQWDNDVPPGEERGEELMDFFNSSRTALADGLSRRCAQWSTAPMNPEIVRLLAGQLETDAGDRWTAAEVAQRMSSGHGH